MIFRTLTYKALSKNFYSKSQFLIQEGIEKEKKTERFRNNFRNFLKEQTKKKPKAFYNLIFILLYHRSVIALKKKDFDQKLKKAFEKENIEFTKNYYYAKLFKTLEICGLVKVETLKTNNGARIGRVLKRIAFGEFNNSYKNISSEKKAKIKANLSENFKKKITEINWIISKKGYSQKLLNPALIKFSKLKNTDKIKNINMYLDSFENGKLQVRMYGKYRLIPIFKKLKKIPEKESLKKGMKAFIFFLDKKDSIVQSTQYVANFIRRTKYQTRLIIKKLCSYGIITKFSLSGYGIYLKFSKQLFQNFKSKAKSKYDKIGANYLLFRKLRSDIRSFEKNKESLFLSSDLYNQIQEKKRKYINLGRDILGIFSAANYEKYLRKRKEKEQAMLKERQAYLQEIAYIRFLKMTEVAKRKREEEAMILKNRTLQDRELVKRHFLAFAKKRKWKMGAS